MKVVASNIYKRTAARAVRVSLAAVIAVSSLGIVVSNILTTPSVHALGGTTIVSQPNNHNGWATQDGAPTYIAGPSGADGAGSLELSTLSVPKQNYFHAANDALSGVNNLGYKLNVLSGIPASYQLQVTGVNRTDTTASTFTSLVWEPVYNGQVNGPNGGFVSESNIENGVWWSSNPIAGAPNRDTFVSLSTILANNPGATVVAYGVSVGSGTPNAKSDVDDVTFSTTTTNFEPLALATPTNGTPNGSYEQSGNGWNYSWSNESASGAVSYEFQASQDSTTTGGALVNNVWNSGTNGSTTQKAALLAGPSIPSEGTSDGTWYWQVRSVGSTGDVSPWSAVWHVTVDTIAPNTPTLESPANNIVTNGASITQSWSDTSTDVDHYIYQSFNDAAATQSRWTENFTTTSKTATDVADATYWWRVIAVDHAGNQSAASQLWKITVDNDAPIVHITAPSASVANGQVTLGGTVADANPDHYYFVVKDSHGNVVAHTNANGSTDGVVFASTVADWTWDTTQVADGTYTIDLEAKDAAGNKDSSSVTTKTVTVDNNAAAPANGLPNGTIEPTNEFDFSWDGVTDPSGAVTYEYRASQDPTQVGTADTTSAWDQAGLVTPMIHSTGAGDGLWYWQVRTIDALGNKSAWSPIWTVTLDTQAPVVAITNFSATDNVITPQVTATDPAPSTGSLTYQWTPNDAASTDNVAISDATILMPTFTVSATGNYAFTLTVTDQANHQTQETFSFTYTQPTVNQPTPPVNPLVVTTTPPATTGFSNVAGTPTDNTGVLGDATNTPSTDTNTSDVKGASTDNKVADTTTTKGNLFGLAWYWWLVILAAIIAIIWWIVAAARNRSAQN